LVRLANRGKPRLLLGIPSGSSLLGLFGFPSGGSNLLRLALRALQLARLGLPLRSLGPALDIIHPIALLLLLPLRCRDPVLESSRRDGRGLELRRCPCNQPRLEGVQLVAHRHFGNARYHVYRAVP
jgi:hypothetical protein